MACIIGRVGGSDCGEGKTTSMAYCHGKIQTLHMAGASVTFQETCISRLTDFYLNRGKQKRVTEKATFGWPICHFIDVA